MSIQIAKTRKTRHLKNSTSDHNFKIPKTLFSTNYPPKPRKNHLRNHFRLLESSFSAIATYKTRIFSKSPYLSISALLWDECGHQGGTKTINSTLGLFRLAWGSFWTNVLCLWQCFSRDIAIFSELSQSFTIGWDQFHTFQTFLGGTSKKPHCICWDRTLKSYAEYERL